MRKPGAECVLISYDGGVWGLCKVYLFSYSSLLVLLMVIHFVFQSYFARLGKLIALGSKKNIPHVFFPFQVPAIPLPRIF